MTNRLRFWVVLGASLTASPVRAAPDDATLRKAVTLYASFDEAVRADLGGGGLTFSTRSNHPTDKGKFVVTKGLGPKAFRIARGKGVQGGALECVDVLPRNGRIFLPAKGNIAFKKGGWGATLSVWIKTDPDKLFKTKFCDPIQITQKGANNGGIWFDFNDANPRDMRMGTFPAVPPGKKGISEADPKAPMVWVKGVGFKAKDWHHIVLTWQNFDTGKPNALAMLYIDGKRIGAVKDRAIGMDWDLDKAGIYVAVGYIGLLDELALFNRPLTAEEVSHLFKSPALLAPLKKSAPKGRSQLPALQQRTADLLVSSPAANDRRLPTLRNDVFRYLDTEAGRRDAEAALQLLLRLPTSGKAPAAPRFPFSAEEASRYQKSYAAWAGLPVELVNGAGLRLVLVPPGTFRMGSPKDEPGHGTSGYAELAHTVTLTRPFYLGKYEVTVGQFRAFVLATKHVTDGEKNGGGNAHDDKAVWKHRPGVSWRKPGYAGPFTMRDDHPVVHVSHDDGKALCRWLQERAGTRGVRYDLPTEAQWEWACRAGSGSRYWWGPDEDMTGKVANVGDRALKRTHPAWPRTIMPMDDGHAFAAPVGSYRPNGFGLHDMLGNVWEFCSTRFGPYPRGHVIDPVGGDPKRGFAVRGGGWSNVAADVRCASRNADPPRFCHSNLGLRVSLQLPARGTTR